PFNYLADAELDSWWLANLVNWIFILIAMAAFVYWMKQLKIFNDRNEEKKDTSAHSFLG
ncbi:uracil phosphoribosyltransferase, partial [Salinimicrobium sp. CDJ15-91]|nr:uracil phosphoribosyltransferase [Salinimicrobium oceani]